MLVLGPPISLSHSLGFSSIPNASSLHLLAMLDMSEEQALTFLSQSMQSSQGVSRIKRSLVVLPFL